jgi:hypothetical protein
LVKLDVQPQAAHALLAARAKFVKREVGEA